jgi:hypothetical protein
LVKWSFILGGIIGATELQPAGLARPARSFLLLAQKKGPKEEGLNTIWLLPLARGFGC